MSEGLGLAEGDVEEGQVGRIAPNCAPQRFDHIWRLGALEIRRFGTRHSDPMRLQRDQLRLSVTSRDNPRDPVIFRDRL